MAGEPLQGLVHGLRRLAERSGGGLTDAQLLERFVAQRDEAAFEVLVWRHRPIVLGVCRRLLRQEQDAEDVFQAAFLALVRKAHTIGAGQAVGSWLYTVAYRAALAARSGAAGRAAREMAWTERVAVDGPDEVLWRDLRPVLDEEVLALPEKYRAPFVLCYLEGKTNEEAARQLGCPRGTILSRLARARERLRQRLTRRGVTLSAGGLILLLAEHGQAALPAGLAGMTIKAAPAGAAGTAATLVSARVAALTEGALRVMCTSRLKTTLTILLAGFVLAGAATLGTGPLASSHGESPRGAVATEPAPRRAASDAATAGKGPDAAASERLQEAQLRIESQHRLREIVVALHNHHDTWKTFPPPASIGNDGKPLLSWRVAILPFLGTGEAKLYRQFKLNEPWDSPHNKGLLAKIPTAYQPVRGASKLVGGTYYQAFVGKGAAFEPGVRLRFTNFTDGTRNTILVVEAAKPVPWTKPSDLPYVVGQPLPALGGQFGGNFNAGFADGEVRFLAADVSRDVLRAMITRSGAEEVDPDKLRQPAMGLSAADGKLVGEVNRKLRDEVQATKREVEKVAADLAELRRLVAHAKEGLEAKASRLLRENLHLTATLRQLRGQLEMLRAELQRARKTVDKE